MRVSQFFSTARLRALVLAGLAVFGLLTIIGSGGGSAPECSFFSDTCTYDGGGGFNPPAVYIQPLRITVQAGGDAVFTAVAFGLASPGYRWQRSTDGGRSYADIAGAGAADLRLTRVQPADDGAVFRVVASQGASTATAIVPARLAVSSLPGVVFQDGEFQPADWQVVATANPAGPTHSEERVATGGNPDAFRRMLHAMPAGPSTISVFHSSLSSTYDPSVQGAVNVIDYNDDCKLLGPSPYASASVLPFTTTLMVEQGGRCYLATPPVSCGVAAWVTAQGLTSLRPSDFVINSGPACGAGESCPDFSASAATLRFGYARATAAPASAGAATIDHGIDNWKVTVWRH
jgi:hypothetical protein